MERPVRIELPTMFGMKTVNAYLFKTPVPTLIDCGENTDACFSALETQLSDQGLSISDIQRIIITHAHVDHIGMAKRIVDASGCKVWVSPLVYPWAVDLGHTQDLRTTIIKAAFQPYLTGDNVFKDMLDNVASFFGTLQNFWQELDTTEVVQFEMDDLLELGGRSWRVIHAPGHCVNQTCFYEAESQEMISADMLLSITPTPVIEGDPVTGERIKGLSVLLESYEKFKNMDISHVYPGHYKEIDQPKKLIEFQVSRIHQRIDETYAFIKSGPCQFSKLLNDLYPGRISLPATNMLLGYLDILRDRDLVQLEEGMISAK